MDTVTLAGVPPYDGAYPLDIAGLELTTREWGWIKRLTGYLPLTVTDGFAGGDPELYAAFAVIALRRAGTIENGDVQRVYDTLLDAPFGSTITLQIGEQADEDDADPPPESSPSRPASSGDESTPSSATSPGPRNGSGTPASVGSGLHPIRSGT